MKTIISICTFLLLFQVSTQYLTTSEESDSDNNEETSSDDSSSSSSSSSSSGSSSEETPQFGPAELEKLDLSQRKEFIQKFLLHLMAMSQLQAEERLIVCAMRHHLPSIFKAKFNHTQSWKKLHRVLDEGAAGMHKILEQKNNITKSEKLSEQPRVIQFFAHAWEAIEKKKFHEAIKVFQKVNEEIFNLGRKIIPSLDDQRKAAFAIDHLIDERAERIDQQSRELREKLENMPIVKTKNTSTSLAPWLLNADDIESIKKQYQEMMNVIPDAQHPEAIKLKSLLKEEGISIPYFCKTLSEMQNVVGKFQSCMLSNDNVGVEILKKTLDQPDYKKCWSLFQESALNLMPGDDKLKDNLRKQANAFLFNIDKLFE